MEKVKIRNCESIMDGKAHAIEFADGRKATAWCDKIDSGLLLRACTSMDEIEVELKPWKTGKGENVVAINYLGATTESTIGPTASPQTIYDAKQGNASANGQYQKCEWPKPKDMSSDEATGDQVRGMSEPLGFPPLPAPEDYGEADITSINAKSSVKIKKNSKGMGWEIKVVTGEVHLIEKLEKAALMIHRDLCKEFPVEAVHVA